MKLININILCLLFLYACQTSRYDSADSVSSLVFERIQQADDEACNALSLPLNAQSTVQVALVHNANVRYSIAELSVAEADLMAAGTIENPVFAFFYGFPVGHDAKNSLDFSIIESVISLCLRQTLVDAASANLESAKWQASHEILNTAFDAESLFYQLKAQELLSGILQGRCEAADSIRQMEEARFAEGGVLPGDLVTTKMKCGLEKDEWLLARAQEAMVRKSFETALGISCGYLLDDQLPFPDDEAWPANFDALILDARADVQALRWRLEGLRRAAPANCWWVKSAAAIGFTFQKDSDGDITMGPNLSGEIPIFDHGQADCLRWNAAYLQTREELIALEQSIIAELKANKELLHLNKMRAELYKEELLPLQTRLAEMAKDSYDARAIDRKEFVEAQSELLDLKAKYIAAVRDYWMAKIELKRSLLQ
jgi:cobalt-zinc-cadmium efflux system outer membrane protein